MITHTSQDFDCIKQYDKFSVVCIKKTPFWEYVGNKEEFMKLHRSEKEEVYLKWRYGSNGREMESSDNFFVHKIKTFGMEGLPEGVKDFWENEVKFHEKCQVLKKEIGLFTNVPTTSRKVTGEIDWHEDN
jgi:hypothetical protein